MMSDRTATTSFAQRPSWGAPRPSHAPPPPCAGSIAAGPGAPDGRNRGSHAARPVGKTVAAPRIGGGPSRAVGVGCPCAIPRTIPRSATAVRRQHRGGGLGAPDVRHRGSHAAPAGRQDGVDPSNRGGPSRAVSVGCPCGVHVKKVRHRRGHRSPDESQAQSPKKARSGGPRCRERYGNRQPDGAGGSHFTNLTCTPRRAIP